eukprot:210432-Rhodomonas_salina.1
MANQIQEPLNGPCPAVANTFPWDKESEKLLVDIISNVRTTSEIPWTEVVDTFDEATRYVTGRTGIITTSMVSGRWNKLGQPSGVDPVACCSFHAKPDEMGAMTRTAAA